MATGLSTMNRSKCILNEFRLVGMTLPGLADPSIAIAASKAGGVGILDLEYILTAEKALKAVRNLGRFGGDNCGLRMRGTDKQLFDAVSAELRNFKNIGLVVLTHGPAEVTSALIDSYRNLDLCVMLEVTSLEQAKSAIGLGVDGLVLKGNEASGFVGEKTSFVLLQQISQHVDVPLWVQGGIGLHTAAGCVAAGAKGLVLDFQLALTRESPLPENVKNHIRRMDGSEAQLVGDGRGFFRLFRRPGTAMDEKILLGPGATADADSAPAIRDADAWEDFIRRRVSWDADEQSLWPMGQDAAFAVHMAARSGSVGAVFRALENITVEHVDAAKSIQIFEEHSPLAVAHGTRYPIVQGPMARISDNVEFIASVAEKGALPFFAISMMSPEEIESALGRLRERMGSLPWGVGLLGFNDSKLYDAQVKAVEQFAPGYAIVAGGRPAQVRALESMGIISYVHVPSPALLDIFIDAGVTRFVFEGNECGGHIGPRTSFVLWEGMVEKLLEKFQAGSNPADYSVLFAGGIHDSLSAAMTACMAAPLARRGVKVGMVMGTAYLLTREIVEASAIVEGYQSSVLDCAETKVLESSPGHAVRCCDTPFVKEFHEKKRELFMDKRPAGEIRTALERLIMGRLRIASRGMDKNPAYGSGSDEPYLVPVSTDFQQREGIFMVGQVAALHSQPLTIDELHREVVEGARARLNAVTVSNSKNNVLSVQEQSPSDVAIIGMSCIFPKAGDLRTYWDNILKKVNAITEIPEKRWDWQIYFDSNKEAKDKIYSRWGGFIKDVPFDPVKYGIPPNTLKSIEPLQLLTLEAVSAALRDAGYEGREFEKARTSVILGTGSGVGDLGQRYIFRTGLPEFFEVDSDDVKNRLSEWTEDTFPGILMNVLAGRVANRFDLGGLNYTVDAACASSLAALYSGVRELECGNSSMVIVGGVDACQSPFTYTCFSKTGALSPTGQCRVFDEKANGTVISEGLAIVVLKRLADAEKDGDRIYAVIKAVAGGSDGRALGLTAPRPEGQILALNRAYSKAGFSPTTVDLFEAHGTGTVVGDKVEAESLVRVLEGNGAAKQSCAVGSVKSMIGHTKGAAGIAGLIKAAMALYNKVLPPTGGVEKPNARVDFANGPLYVNTELRPWIRNDHPRRAGVSAFGFGGTNFHVSLEEYEEYRPTLIDRPVITEWPSELLIFRGHSREDILKLVDQSLNVLSNNKDLRLLDLSFTLFNMAKKTESEGAAFALALVASTSADALEKLRIARRVVEENASTDISSISGVYFVEPGKGIEGKLALLFPGQGSQYPSMLKEAAAIFPEIRTSFERVDEVLRERFPEGLHRHIFPPPCFTAEQEEVLRKTIARSDIAQPSLGAASRGVYSLLRSLGLTPDMLAGHSYGEYSALTAAGVMDEDTLYRVSEARGRIMLEAASGGDSGTMAAVRASASELKPLIPQLGDITLANMNSPRQTVISGTTEAVENAMKVMEANGLQAQRIPVSCAFHSPLMSPAKDRLVSILDKETFVAPGTQVFSNTTALPYGDSPEEIRACLVQHIVRPVEFVKQIEAMYEAGARVFVEVGPGTVLTNLVRQILEGRPFLALATNISGQGDIDYLLKAVGQLALNNVPLSLDRLYTGREPRHVDLNAIGREPAYSPTTWLVNGSEVYRPSREWKERSQSPGVSAYKIRDRRRVPDRDGKMPIHVSTQQALSAESPQYGKEAMNNADIPVNTAMHDRVALPQASAADSVMLQFQQMMERFLDVQKTVMTAYLQGGIRSAGVDTGLVATRDIRQEVVSQPEILKKKDAGRTEGDSVPAVPVSAKTSTPDKVSPDTGPSLRDRLKKDLLRVSSDRTGYPEEMLGFDADMEADLGIDSIKRVEIVGALVKVLSASEQERVRPVAEELSRLKTLSAVLDRLVAAVGLTASSLPEVAAPKAEDKSSLRDRLKKDLLRVSSDRTGYPEEMLGFDADMEADLGIDSIKRVEIVGALVKVLSASEQERVRPVAEELSRLKTLGAMLDRLVAAVGLTASSLPEVAAPKAEDKSSMRDRLKKDLLRVSSDRTGYPEEMLGFDADMEADLGIDSIKRVEIVGALVKVLSAGEQERVRPIAEELSRLKTLGAVLDRLVDAVTETGVETGRRCADNSDAPPSESMVAAESVPRFVVRNVALSSSPKKTEISVKGVLVITDDGSGIATLLADKLNKLGVRTVILSHATSPATLNVKDGTVSVDLSDTSSVNASLDKIRETMGAIGGLVHLKPAGNDGSFASLAINQWKQHLDIETLGLFRLGRALSRDLREAAKNGGSWFMAVAVNNPAGEGPLGQAGMAGLVKSLAQEWPEVVCRVVHVDLPYEASALASRLAEEMTIADGPVEVILQDQKRLVRHPGCLPVATEAGERLDIGQDWVVLITGGAVGITAEIALELAARFRPTLILAGRTALPEDEESPDISQLETAEEIKKALIARFRSQGENPTPVRVESACRAILKEREIRANIRAMTDAGATVHYFQVDVRDAESFGGLVDKIYSKFGRLDGVVHGAGIIEDKLIELKSDESFERVFDTKVSSSFILSRKINPESLKFMVFFTSVAGFFGNRGQADYAAANEVVNELARYLDRKWAGRVVAINWGPWGKLGMVSQAVAKQFRERGVQLIPPADGVRCFMEELLYGRKGDVEVVIGDGPWGLDPDGLESNNGQETGPIPAEQATSHRQQSLRKFDDGVVELSHTLSLSDAPYLDDHRLDGKPVVPVAGAAELIAGFAEMVAPGWHVESLHGLRLLQGIILDEEKGKRVLFRAQKPEQNGSESRMKVEILNGDGKMPFYKATAVLRRRRKKSPACPVGPIPAGDGQVIKADKAYAEYLFHGERFRLIRTIDRLNTEGADAMVMHTDPASWLGNNGSSEFPNTGWVFDPGLVDTAPQMAIVWSRVNRGSTALPTGIGAITRYGPLPDNGPLHLYFRVKDDVDPHTLTYDAFFVDDDGRVRLVMQDVESACNASLNRLAGTK